MNYSDAMAFLNSFIDYEKIAGSYYDDKREELTSIRAILDRTGNPENDLNFVHIAGTKGKGSTAAMAASIFTEAGMTTGLYTSPHLVHFNERIQIDGKRIPDEDLVSQVETIADAAVAVRDDPETGELSFFEVYTALAFRYFKEKSCDIVVLETGLGGRLDATNVVQPRACAITLIGRDHEAILGDTIEKIAVEKAGIMKKDIPVVVSPQSHSEAEQTLIREARDRGAKLYFLKEVMNSDSADNLLRFKSLPSEDERMVFSLRGIRHTYASIATRLIGHHQIANAATAVVLAELATTDWYDLKEDHVKTGLMQTHLEGRFQIIDRNPFVVLDGAHNPESATALKRSLEEFLEYENLIIVFGGMADHNLRTIAETLFPLASRVILTRSENPRAAEPDDLMNMVGDLCEACDKALTASDALVSARRTARSQDAILVTGSLYIAGEILRSYS